jgi:hypothetical protein
VRLFRISNQAEEEDCDWYNEKKRAAGPSPLTVGENKSIKSLKIPAFSRETDLERSFRKKG